MANGIPSLLGKVANVTNTISLVVADAQLILGMFGGPKWGIFYQNGSIALQPDSIIAVDFKREWLISDYPQEQGAFQTYNKVKTPTDLNVRMTKGGTEDDRANFLVAVAKLAGSLALVKVVMPDVTMTNVNILRFDFRRTSTNGIGLLTVDVALREIRVAPSPAFTNTAAPSGADPQNGGAVQPQPPTTGMSALFGPNTVNFQ